MTERFGSRRVPRLLRKVQRHRELVRVSGNTELEASWDAIEQFIDFLYQEVGARDNVSLSKTQPTDSNKIAKLVVKTTD